MFVAPFGFKSFGLDIEPMGDATDEEYFEFGDGVIRGYSDDGPKDLVIPSKIDGKKVTEIGSGAFRYNKLESVDIPDSVTKIGSEAFRDNNLTSVDIPDSVTEIGSYAFRDNKLESVDIPDSVTEIGSNAFSYNNLESVDIPDSVTEIGSYAFSNNYLTSVDISDSVTKIGSYAFQNNNLTKFIVPTNVEELGYGAISDNDDLKEIFLLPVNITFTKFSNMTPFTGTPDDLVLFGIPESDIDDDGTKTILEDFAEKEEIELRPLLGTINPNGTKKWESDLKLRINDFKEIIDINNFRCTYQKVNINGEYGSCSTDKPLIFEDPGRYTVTLEGEVNDHDLVYKSEEFKFDNAGPNIKLDGSEEVISSEEEEIEITVKDEHSGLAKVEYTWTDNKDENINEADYDNKRNFNGEIESEIIFTNIPEEIGVHYLHVRAIDEVGNVNKQYFKTERIGTLELFIDDTVLSFDDITIDGTGEQSTSAKTKVYITDTRVDSGWDLRLKYDNLKDDVRGIKFRGKMNAKVGSNTYLEGMEPNAEQQILSGDGDLEEDLEFSFNVPKEVKFGEYKTEITFTLITGQP